MELIFKEFQIRNKKLILKDRKQKGLSEEEINAIRSVKKPKRVKPNYKKKIKLKLKSLK